MAVSIANIARMVFVCAVALLLSPVSSKAQGSSTDRPDPRANAEQRLIKIISDELSSDFGVPPVAVSTNGFDGITERAKMYVRFAQLVRRDLSRAIESIEFHADQADRASINALKYKSDAQLIAQELFTVNVQFDEFSHSIRSPEFAVLTTEISRVLEVLRAQFPKGLSPVERLTLTRLLGESYIANVIQAQVESFEYSTDGKRDRKILAGLRFWLASEIIAREAFMPTKTEMHTDAIHFARGAEKYELSFLSGTAVFGALTAFVGQLPTESLMSVTTTGVITALSYAALLVTSDIKRKILATLNVTSIVSEDAEVKRQLGPIKSALLKASIGERVASDVRFQFWDAANDFAADFLKHSSLKSERYFEDVLFKYLMGSIAKAMYATTKIDPSDSDAQIAKLRQKLLSAVQRVQYSQAKPTRTSCEQGAFL